MYQSVPLYSAFSLNFPVSGVKSRVWVESVHRGSDIVKVEGKIRVAATLLISNEKVKIKALVEFERAIVFEVANDAEPTNRRCLLPLKSSVRVAPLVSTSSLARA